mgnify:FL=1|tara:strand:+ start:3968 stop:4321 length:354 start_codon:yes stop_codon:yes gene_type:complete
MLKKVLTIAAASALSTPAFAGFYLSVENNGSYEGKNFSGSGTDVHLGYEGGNSSASYYLQGGAFLSNPDNGESSTDFSGKVGGSVAATDKIDFYGELSIVTDKTNSYGTKLGLKYKF